MTGIISNIQRFSMHDGPGVRTTVFFKGCPLRCIWCHNPETYEFGRELRYRHADCVGCGGCVDRCACGALRMSETGVAWDRAKCGGCFECARECPTGALSIAGSVMSVDDVLREVMEDRSIYERTGGGVTLSGGEASAQFEFSVALLFALKREGIHTAIDTCGLCDASKLRSLSTITDLILYDIKHGDQLSHERLTGVGNRQRLENLSMLGEVDVPVEVRIPVIPGMNDSASNIDAMAEIIARNRHIRSAVLLAYHPLGQAKIYRFDQRGCALNIVPPGRVRMEALAERIREITGIPVTHR